MWFSLISRQIITIFTQSNECWMFALSLKFFVATDSCFSGCFLQQSHLVFDVVTTAHIIVMMCEILKWRECGMVLFVAKTNKTKRRIENYEKISQTKLFECAKKHQGEYVHVVCDQFAYVWNCRFYSHEMIFILYIYILLCACVNDDKTRWWMRHYRIEEKCSPKKQMSHMHKP